MSSGRCILRQLAFLQASVALIHMHLTFTENYESAVVGFAEYLLKTLEYDANDANRAVCVRPQLDLFVGGEHVTMTPDVAVMGMNDESYDLVLQTAKVRLINQKSQESAYNR